MIPDPDRIIRSDLDRIIRYAAFVLVAEGNEWQTAYDLAGKINAMFGAEFHRNVIATRMGKRDAAWQYHIRTDVQPKQYQLSHEFYVALTNAVRENVQAQFKTNYSHAEGVRWLARRSNGRINPKIGKIWQAAVAKSGSKSK